jgi:glycosyltransferase involved in cell wall biosynthesis
VHVLFVHKNFPAQFGHIAHHLVARHGWRCTFVSETAAGTVDGIEKIQYRPGRGATAQSHYCARTFENAIWHASGVYQALRPHRHTLRPDLIVGHSGFGSTLFLPELFPDTPIINYFEYFYRPHGSDLDFRREWAPPEINYLRSRARNAMILLDLEACAAGYTPTHFQKSLFPETCGPKLRVLHDGIDLAVWRRIEQAPRTVGTHRLDPETRIVTYVSRGLESMRGFDIFMRAAKRIYQQYPNVLFLVVGSPRVCYGGDLRYIKERTFLEHVLRQDNYDRRKIRFLGRVPPRELTRLLSLSDLHIYLTVPFVLSWSLLNAMACGCVVLGSNTPPVAEVITQNRNGLLCDFFDVEGLAAAALAVLREPAAYRPLGQAAAETISDEYSLDVMLPRLLEFYSSVANPCAVSPQVAAAK